MRKITYSIMLIALIFSLSGCIQIHDNKKNIFEGFQLQKKESAMPVGMHEQIRRCYKNVNCLEGSTFLYHFYGDATNPEKHLPEIIGFYYRDEMHRGDKDGFKHREIIKKHSPITLKRMKEAAQTETVTIFMSLPLSAYDFNTQSFDYTLPQSVYLMPKILRHDTFLFPELYKIPIFRVNFSHNEIASTFNVVEAQASILPTILHGGFIERGQGFHRKILRHKLVKKGTPGNRLITIKLKVKLEKPRSMKTLHEISEYKKEYIMKATILQYQMINEAGEALKTVDLR